MSDWLRRGEKEANEGIDTIFVNIYIDFKHEQAVIVSELLGNLRQSTNNYIPLTWILEKCFREDFGNNQHRFKN